MDTSTISFSDDPVPDAPRTLSSHSEHPEPGPLAHTFIGSPLTKLKEGDQPDPLPKLHLHAETSKSSKSETERPSKSRLPKFSSPLKSYYSYQVQLEPTMGVKMMTLDEPEGPPAVLIIFIPILVVILTVLLGVLIFLIALLCLKRKNGIRLTEDGGPLDLSKGEGVIGEGGVEGVEARWLETADPDVREAYRRAKGEYTRQDGQTTVLLTFADWQMQYPPSSVPTDITLSQFLSIQEKGVSAWAFEPDYEENLSLYVQSRTEITFLSDGPGMAPAEGGGNSVMANLPLPKLNEVYYWEVKMYDKPATTEVAIGLATKPYPSFRLPGWNRFSVAYFASDGFKSHNYPFTASSYGAPLAEGDVLGVGYRPRTGTVFFTRNGRKLEDCYTGLNRLNLFPTVGANGPCTLHINLGQAGFVFIEANVKKWGLAPMVGTLAPPPAYGSERGSILLDAGYGTPGSSQPLAGHGGIGALLEAARARAAAQLGSTPGSTAPFARPVPVAGPSAPSTPRASHRRHRKRNTATSIPSVPSPLRAGRGADAGPSSSASRSADADEDPVSYVSPTDTPQVTTRVPSVDIEDEESASDDEYTEPSAASSLLSPNPPTPGHLDISLHSLRGGIGGYFSSRGGSRSNRSDGSGASSGTNSGDSGSTVRPGVQRSPSLGPPEDSPPPPGYAPLDPHVYSQGLPADLPEDLINQAIAAMNDGA